MSFHVDFPKSSSMPGMLSADSVQVRDTLRAAQVELQFLIEQRAELMKRIGTLKQTILGIADLVGIERLDGELLELVGHKSSGRKLGFTATCRIILMQASTPLTARAVWNLMQQRDPQLALEQKAPLSSVTTVLNRLVESGEVCRKIQGTRTRVFSWVATRIEAH
jgi:hypothetical protein